MKIELPKRGEVERRWQCNACGEVINEDKAPRNCPRCGSPSIREASGRLDQVDLDAVKHLFTKVEKCFNYSVDEANNKSYHDLDLETVVDEDHVVPEVPEQSYVIVMTRCKTCQTLYNRGLIPTKRMDVLVPLYKKYGWKLPEGLQIAAH